MKKRTLTMLATGASVLGTLALPGLALAEEKPPPPPKPSPCFSIVLENPSNPNKGSLCHFTGSDSNPDVQNEVGRPAVENHFGHHGDCYKFFNEPQVCIL